jgi:hypothetical protein
VGLCETLEQTDRIGTRGHQTTEKAKTTNDMKTTILSLKELAGLLLIIITGCATQNPNAFWFNPNKTAEQEREDMAGCRNEARLGTPPMYAQTTGDAIFNGIIQGNRANAIFSDCMISKGYSLVATNNLVANPAYGAQFFSADPNSQYYQKGATKDIWLGADGRPLSDDIAQHLNSMPEEARMKYVQIPFIAK